MCVVLEVPFIVRAVVGQTGLSSARHGAEDMESYMPDSSHSLARLQPVDLDPIMADLRKTYCEACAGSQAYRMVMHGNRASLLPPCAECPVKKIDM